MEKARELAVVNNFKKIAELMDFFRKTPAKRDASPYAALCSMTYNFTDSDGENSNVDGEDIFLELPVLVKFAETEVETCFELDDDEKDLCIEALNSVRHFVSQCGSGMHWGDVKSKNLSPSVIMSLKLAASTIKASGIKNKIGKKFAIQCASDLSEIRVTIIDSLIAEPLKSHLISTLSHLIHVFDTIEAYGVRDSEEKIKILIADIFLNSSSIPESEQPKLKPLLSKLGLILTKFRNSVGNVKAIEYVAETYDKIL